MKPRDLEQIDALIARRMAAQAPAAPATERVIDGRRIRAHAVVDENNLVYDLKPRHWLNGNTIGWFVTIGILAALAWLILPGLLSAPQTTVDAPPTIAPTVRPLPTRAAVSPAQDAPVVPAAPAVVVPPAPTEAPAWVSGGGDQIAPQAQDIPTPVLAWHAPMAVPAGGIPSECAAWHAPLPYPTECAAWHAPLVVKP